MNDSKKVIKELLAKYPIKGLLSTHPMFGGTGLLINDVMFGWIYKKKLYLRASENYLTLYLELKMPPLNLPSGAISKLLQYYGVTAVIWKNNTQLKELVDLSISGALQDLKNRKKLKESRLRDLPNLTLSIERQLIFVGIYDIASLKQVGAIQAFFLIKQRNRNISSNLLYTLFAAINGRHVATLSVKIKNDLDDLYSKFKC